MNSVESTPSSPPSEDNSIKPSPLKFYATADHKVVDFEADESVQSSAYWYAKGTASTPDSGAPAYEKEFTFNTKLKALRFVRSEVTTSLTQSRQSIKYWHNAIKNLPNPGAAYIKRQCQSSRAMYINNERATKALLADIETQIAMESI